MPRERDNSRVLRVIWELQRMIDPKRVALRETAEELAESREQIAWIVRRCNEAMGDGFSGTPNSSVAAVCDSLKRLRSQGADRKQDQSSPAIPVLAVYCEATRRLDGFELQIGNENVYLHPDDAAELHEQLDFLLKTAEARRVSGCLCGPIPLNCAARRHDLTEPTDCPACRAVVTPNPTDDPSDHIATLMVDHPWRKSSDAS